MASEASLILASARPSPSRIAAVTQCLRWSSRSPRATFSKAAVTALIWVRMSMQ